MAQVYKVGEEESNSRFSGMLTWRLIEILTGGVEKEVNDEVYKDVQQDIDKDMDEEKKQGSFTPASD